MSGSTCRGRNGAPARAGLRLTRPCGRHSSGRCAITAVTVLDGRGARSCQLPNTSAPRESLPAAPGLWMGVVPVGGLASWGSMRLWNWHINLPLSCDVSPPLQAAHGVGRSVDRHSPLESGSASRSASAAWAPDRRGRSRRRTGGTSRSMPSPADRGAVRVPGRPASARHERTTPRALSERAAACRSDRSTSATAVRPSATFPVASDRAASQDLSVAVANTLPSPVARTRVRGHDSVRVGRVREERQPLRDHGSDDPGGRLSSSPERALTGCAAHRGAAGNVPGKLHEGQRVRRGRVPGHRRAAPTRSATSTTTRTAPNGASPVVVLARRT